MAEVHNIHLSVKENFDPISNYIQNLNCLLKCHSFSIKMVILESKIFNKEVYEFP